MIIILVSSLKQHLPILCNTVYKNLYPTDLTQDHVLAVIFQYVTPDGKVHVVFYRLIRLHLDESSEGHLMEFKKAMEKDDLWDAAKNRLIAVVSDGGNMGCRVCKRGKET